MLKNKKFVEGGDFPYVLTLTGDDLIEQCAYFINKAKTIVVLSGAGISTSRGIPDFRSKFGWYSKAPQQILSLTNLYSNTKEVLNFLNKYYSMINVEPSFSHKFLYELEEQGKQVSIITQNVDLGHTEAGNTDIIEFHGSFKKAICNDCGREYNISKVLNDNINDDEFDFKCTCGGIIRPDIVLFGEAVRREEEAIKKIKEADLLIVIGTSMVVQPFASLPSKAKPNTPIIVINNSSTYLDEDRMAVIVKENCDDVLLKIKNKL